MSRNRRSEETESVSPNVKIINQDTKMAQKHLCTHVHAREHIHTYTHAHRHIQSIKTDPITALTLKSSADPVA